eukprot:7375812-Prymnesium_polylepis.3
MGASDFAVKNGQHAKAICKQNPPQHKIVRGGKQPRLLCLASLRVPDEIRPALVAFGPDQRAERKQIRVDKQENELGQQDGLRAKTAQRWKP